MSRKPAARWQRQKTYLTDKKLNTASLFNKTTGLPIFLQNRYVCNYPITKINNDIH